MQGNPAFHQHFGRCDWKVDLQAWNSGFSNKKITWLFYLLHGTVFQKYCCDATHAPNILYQSRRIIPKAIIINRNLPTGVYIICWCVVLMKQETKEVANKAVFWGYTSNKPVYKSEVCQTKSTACEDGPFFFICHGT